MLIFKKGVVNYFMSNLNVRISSALANNTKATIQSELDKIKGLNVNVQVNTSNIKTSVEKAVKDALKSTNVGSINLPTISTKGIKNISSAYKTEFQQLSKMAREIGSLEFKISGLDASKNKSELATLTKQLNDFKRDYSSLLKSIGGNLSVEQWGKLQGVIEGAKAKVDAFKQSAADKIQFAIDVKDYDVKVKTIENSFKNLGVEGEKLKQEMKGVLDALEALKAPKKGQSLIDLDSNFNAEVDKAINNVKLLKMDLDSIYNPSKQAKLSNDILNWLTKNTAASKEARQTLQQYYDQLQGGKVNLSTLERIQAELREIDAQQRGLGKLGKNLRDQFKQAGESFAQWVSVSSAIMFGIQKTREAVVELKELDNILTEISKTSDLTATQLERLGDSAFETASKYGKKASDYLTGVQEMYRAGFNNAEQMAELSVLAQSAGDMDATAANNYLMATNAAYKYKGSVEELNKVLDGQNYITNNAAISMKDISDATSETASVAAQYGVQINELSALIATATANTRESGSEVGTALKAILINLQDTTSKPVTETFDALGISMTKVVDGAERLKTPIELIYELADAYNSLPEGDVMRANILNEIGQKRHANTLASILSDMESYEKMLDLYSSSSADGSALREAEKSANNLQGSLNKLGNTWTDTVENIANSEGLKTGVSALNGVLTIVNGITSALGTFGTVGLSVIALMAKNSITFRGVWTSITGGVKMNAPKYARHTVVVTLNELMMNMVSLTRLYVAMPEME